MLGKIRLAFLTRHFDKLVAAIFLVYSLACLSKLKSITFYNSANLLAKPLTIMLLILASRPSSKLVLDGRTLIGLILSYGSIFIFKFSPLPDDITSSYVLYFSLFFYTLITLVGLITIGADFGILPAFRNLRTKGIYSEVRHPIYSSYIHGAFCVLSFAPSFQNFVASLALSIGLYIRAKVEEDTIAKSLDYSKYSESTPRRFVSISMSLPLILVITYSLFFHTTTKHSTAPVRASFGYPVLSLDPTRYDDWSSVFVANHIFLSIIPQRPSLAQFSLAQNLRLVCAAPSSTSTGSPACERVKIDFVFRKIRDCSGELFTAAEFRKELSAILVARNWIFRGLKFCDNDDENNICIEVENESDISRKLESVYFRFGWSRLKFVNDKLEKFGFGPYCISATRDKTDHFIHQGSLNPLDKKLPLISFKNYIEAHEPFDFDLYGDGLGESGYGTSDTRTPLGYYLVSNHAVKHALPWEDSISFEIIHSFLKGVHLIREDENLTSFLPKQSLNNFDSTVLNIQAKPTLWLPDYIPLCTTLALKLNKHWKNRGFAKCVNTNEKLAGFVIPRSRWYGFISPVSPGAPTRTAVSDQYFSPQSRESWTDGVKARFKLIGPGNATITLNKNRFCSVKSTKMGLGDLLITDFEACP